MNAACRLLLPGLILTIMAATARAQTTPPGKEEEEDKRVQYQLVLPDEKTPETVKPEEHNPFESENEALSRQNTGDTEENRVRDRLLKLPVVGIKRMEDGRMRVLLGDIILETGRVVPPVLPGQLVELRVKNITAEHIELAWTEKRMTGLPPKLMLIPINISPQVRYIMHGQTEEEAKKSRSVNAKMSLPPRDPALAAKPQQPAAAPAATAPAPLPAAAATPEAVPPRAQLVADDPTPFSPPRMAQPAQPEPPAVAQQKPAPSAPGQPAAPTGAAATAAAPAPADQQQQPASQPPSPAVESVVRMLFGNPTPAPK
ncbi:hypothetical protein [Prosthecobacter vanneervenii]|uniref:Uncharacterized protein n=1 Tax=Prosthecobacter vanneervenii TaxID=48466 RepID=A0A7W7Y831_9BACT|nr:hypothetical protein [Prosthecobacter vanneervenii]MBB5031152.1 hypothetical protein [Prosthecobacter vanneervenii]